MTEASHMPTGGQLMLHLPGGQLMLHLYIYGDSVLVCEYFVGYHSRAVDCVYI